MINYHNKKFRAISNSPNGEVSSQMIFHYQQHGNVLTCAYSGGEIIKGHLIGLVDDKGNIDMRYHQVNAKGNLMTGTCKSTPELLENGKIRLHEKWAWTSGDCSHGESVLEEVG
ncbi:n-acetylglutamate synthase [Belliella sp. DSM 107340]|uniref:N-acetylglutamate synthase n=1 Tax=Belliella calami TaxID=2923436 RepID=A0ABS9UMI2_9BACT|nr:n-acetylglutamate synthase [Belliella calami]MCH7397797.1 n-acetylglutamate synthase [Belliella calami]